MSWLFEQFGSVVFKPQDRRIQRYVPSTLPGLRIARTACDPSSSTLVPFREPIHHGWAVLGIGEPSNAEFVSRRRYFAAYCRRISEDDPEMLPSCPPPPRGGVKRQRGFQATGSEDPTLRTVHTAWTTYSQDSMSPFVQRVGSLPRASTSRLGHAEYRRA